jgi:hypothetical protein
MSVMVNVAPISDRCSFISIIYLSNLDFREMPDLLLKKKERKGYARLNPLFRGSARAVNPLYKLILVAF